MTFRSKRTDRRDHYLPQGYLRGFIDPSREKQPQPLWRFDIPYNIWSQRSTKEVGHLRGFYDYAGALAEVEIADSSFLELENAYPRIRDKMIANNFSQWTEHLDFLLRYMQMMRSRSLLFFDQMEAEGKSLRALTIKEISPDRKRITLQSMTPLPVPHTFIRNRALTLMREEIQKGASWLKDFNWALRYCDSPADPFVATETPFVASGSCAKVKHPETLLYFPLCWQACLIGSAQPFNVETDRADRRDLQTIRRLYRENATLFVVSPQKLKQL